MYKQALVINGRNLGDAVIQSRSVRKLVDGGFAERIIVWTRADCAPASAGDPRIDVVTSPFPWIAKGWFGTSELRAFWSAARAIGRRKPEISLDFFGDKREWLFARMVGWQEHVAIAWAPRHPFRRALGLTRRQRLPDGSTIPADVTNVYEAYDLFVETLLKGEGRNVVLASPRPRLAGGIRRIGLHPFASRECNIWPDEHWVALARSLLDREAEVWVFGSPDDRPRIEQIFEPIGHRIRTLAAPLHVFLADVGTMDVMIGLDSLGVHAADRAGVPSIVIAGASPKDMWRPPMAVAIGQSGGCTRYPCYNRPVCTTGPERFACIRSVRPAQVLQLLDTFERAPT